VSTRRDATRRGCARSLSLSLSLSLSRARARAPPSRRDSVHCSELAAFAAMSDRHLSLSLSLSLWLRSVCAAAEAAQTADWRSSRAPDRGSRVGSWMDLLRLAEWRAPPLRRKIVFRAILSRCPFRRRLSPLYLPNGDVDVSLSLSLSLSLSAFPVYFGIIYPTVNKCPGCSFSPFREDGTSPPRRRPLTVNDDPVRRTARRD